MSGASVAPPDDLCGATILENLTLDQDVACTGSGLIAGSDGIRIDLNGHTIAGSGTGIGVNVTGRTRVSIVGGRVRNFATGVLILNSTDVVVHENELLEDGDGIDIQAGSVGNTVKDNHFEGNRARGIMVRSNTNANVIKDNTFTGDRVGILLFGSLGSTVKDNVVSSSGLAGIRINVIATANTLKDNTVLSNPAGIEFLVTPTGSAVGNTVRENTLALNTCGLKGPVAGNTLKDNQFQGNASDSCQ
jgi:parallel beta-helix repeat protein